MIGLRRLGMGFLLALTMAVPVGAAVVVNDTELTPQEGWIQNGTSYVTLRGLDRVLENSRLRWETTDGTAVLEGEGFTLSAPLGQRYIEMNGRALYHPQGVTAPNGHTALPLRLVADALEGEIYWDEGSGTATLQTGMPNPAEEHYNADDLYWLSRILSAESRGESLEGQIGVGNVVLNRVASVRYPNNIYGVIFDRKHGVQFEPVINGTVYHTPTHQSVLAAKMVLEGATVVGEAMYFFAPALSPGTWIRQNTTYLTTIGCHQFYID